MARRTSRRRFLVGAAGTAAAVGLGPRPAWPIRSPAGRDVDRALRTVLDPEGTTLAVTIVPTGAGPYRTLTEGPGEPHTVRGDLVAPRDGREDRRRTVAAIVHFTDQHIVDAQSPGRVDFLDLADPLFGGAFRPQELLTTQVATSMVERVNRLGRGPVGGRAFDAVVCTGDNIDNQQRNELDWLMAVLDGGLVQPDSGQVGTYEGIQDDVVGGPDWWHPEPGVPDDFKTVGGFPDVPGLLSAATAPFTSPGLDVAWFSVYGNHDCNVQGNGRRTDSLDAILVGDRKITGLPPGVGGLEFVVDVLLDSPSVLARLQAGDLPHRIVAPDGRRRTATVDDWLAAHLASATGTHGYSAEDRAAGRLYYEFEIAPGVVGISLDTTNHAGGVDGAGGSVGEAQLAWLIERLNAHHVRHLDADGRVVRSGGDDRVVLVFSHHTSATMRATDPDPARLGERRVLGDEVVATLLRYPNVVAWINGHTHTNEVHLHRAAPGVPGGFWEVATASHVDWPQQARIIEVADNADGTMSIFTTMIEHVGPVRADRSATDPAGLAGLARELGANDANAKPSRRAGDPLVRNVELVLPAPFAVLSDPTTPTAVDAPRPAPATPVRATPGYTG